MGRRRQKGDRWERTYRNGLNADKDDVDDYEALGVSDYSLIKPFTAIRIPSSGSATTDDLPDLHVWYNPIDTDVLRQYAVEAKAVRENLHVSQEDVYALRRYAQGTGAEPVFFIHVDYVGDFVVPVDELHQTEKGYTFRENRDVEDAQTLEDWISSR